MVEGENTIKIKLYLNDDEREFADFTIVGIDDKHRSEVANIIGNSIRDTWEEHHLCNDNSFGEKGWEGILDCNFFVAGCNNGENEGEV